MKPSKKQRLHQRTKRWRLCRRTDGETQRKKQKNAGKEYVQDGTEEKVHEKQ